MLDSVLFLHHSERSESDNLIHETKDFIELRGSPSLVGRGIANPMSERTRGFELPRKNWNEIPTPRAFILLTRYNFVRFYLCPVITVPLLPLSPPPSFCREENRSLIQVSLSTRQYQSAHHKNSPVDRHFRCKRALCSRVSSIIFVV